MEVVFLKSDASQNIEAFARRQHASPDDTGLPYDVAGDHDGSLLGAVLSKWLNKLGYKKHGGCGCHQMARSLNRLPLEFLKKHHRELTDEMHARAQRMNYRAPRSTISVALSLARHAEAARLAQRRVRGKPVGHVVYFPNAVRSKNRVA